MSIQETLQRALECLSQLREQQPGDPEALAEARAWLARTETLLDWIAKHPKMHEINCEAAGLLFRYRGTVGS